MRRLLKTASFRLSILYTAVFAVCFASLLFITYWTATAALRDQIRSKIAEDLQALIAEATNDGTNSIIQDINERLQIAGEATGYYYLADSRGQKLAGNLDRLETKDGWREADFSESAVPTSRSQLDQDHQLWGQGTHLADGSFLFVGQDAFRVLSVQEAIIESFAWSMAIAFVLAALAGLLVSQGFLSRIDAINKTSLAIMNGSLKERIPIRGTSDEIDRLSMNLNRLFDNNQSLLESLKQVTTNIAHDLRSPLSRLRQNLEATRIGSGDIASYEEAVDSAIVESDHLLATFSALLRIAQIESGSRKSGFRTVNLTEVLERVTTAYRAVAEDESKELNEAFDNGILVHGDGELLLQMAANLIENAIRHTPPRTKIAFTLSRSADGPIVTVSDSGPGIPLSEREKVFERFYRLDASRTTPGNGLGLALVAAVATLHGIRVSLEDNNPGLKVILRFPEQG